MSLGSVIGADIGQSLVRALGSDCAAGAALAAHLEGVSSSFPRGRALGGLSAAAVERAATDFANRGWLEVRDGGWRRTALPLPVGLSAFLAGAEAMRSSLRAEMDSTVVVTLPLEPSAITKALPLEGPIHASVGITESALAEIARSSVNKFTVLSPFVNTHGAEFLQMLFDRSAAPGRTLVTRYSGETRSTLAPLLPAFEAKGIRVLNYLLPFDYGAYETFHAKVVVADRDHAYVGSANMTRYARHSMEIGVVVKGRAARGVAALVRAVERIAQPLGDSQC